MDLDFGFFYNSFVVIKYVLNSLIGTLGEHFNTVIYFAIIIGSVSTIFGLGVSIVKRSTNSKKGG